MATDLLDSLLASTAFADGVRQGFWRLAERVGDVLYVEVIASDGFAYVLELTCDRLGDEPIRGRFVDPSARSSTAGAWPQGDNTFGGWFKWTPNDLFICWPADRGGVEHHPEWRAMQHWRKTGNQLVQYLEFIRQCLNLPARGYQPRPRSAA